MVLTLSPYVTVAQPLLKVLQRKIPFSGPIEGTDYQIDIWVSTTVTVIMTPQGIRTHTSIVAQGKIYDTVANTYVGKISESGFSSQLIPSEPTPPEDSRMVWSAMLNIPGKDMQGIEGRMKTLFIMQNEDIKVNIYLEWLNL